MVTRGCARVPQVLERDVSARLSLICYNFPVGAGRLFVPHWLGACVEHVDEPLTSYGTIWKHVDLRIRNKQFTKL